MTIVGSGAPKPGSGIAIGGLGSSTLVSRVASKFAPAWLVNAKRSRAMYADMRSNAAPHPMEVMAKIGFR
jgi:hypothetical protein